MNNPEAELSQRLKDAVPPPPEPSGWGPAARNQAMRTRRRRLRAAAGVTVAAVTAALLATAMLFGTRGAARHAEPIATVPDLSTGCPDPTTRLPYPPAGQVRADPVAVRLCKRVDAYTGTDTMLERDYPLPTVELTQNPQAIVDLVNNLPEFPLGIGCPPRRGPVIAVWFAYSDGTTEAVKDSFSGCPMVIVNKKVPPRSGGDSLLRGVEARIAAQ